MAAVALTGVDAFDAGSQHFGDIGRICKDQRDSPPDIGRIPWARQAQSRDAKADKIHQQNNWDAPKQIDIDGPKDTQRKPEWVRVRRAPVRSPAPAP